MPLCDPWTDPDDAVGVCSACDDASFTDDQWETSILLASGILYELSGRKWPGICVDTIRPRGRIPEAGPPPSSMLPTAEGNGGNGGNGGCGCSGRSSETVILPNGPIIDVTEVTVDGVVLAASAYRVDDGRVLRRVDGRTFPCCQNLNDDTTATGTFEVVYEWGAAPPADAAVMAGLYACELVQAIFGTDDDCARCRLPRNAQTVSRQGVGIVLADPTALANEGLTGLPEIDAWLRAVNPDRRRVRALISYPGKPRAHRQSDLGGS